MTVEVTFSRAKSIVDAPFFSQLSKHKLDDAKLDVLPINVAGYASMPFVSNRRPIIRLTSDSFSASTDTADALQDASEVTIPGVVMNTNTIEEFRDLDKIDFLKRQTAQLGAQIRSGEAIERPDLLCQFFLLTFADLKKYKFYYWFLFPTLKWVSEIISVRDVPDKGLNDIMAGQREIICLLTNSGAEPIRNLSKSVTAEPIKLGMLDLGTNGSDVPWYLRNVAAMLSAINVQRASIYAYRRDGNSKWIELKVGRLSEAHWLGEGCEGWERNALDKLVPKLTDLSTLMNPKDLADQAVDLNLKLMKWRAAPQLDLEAVSSSKCLLLGAGTLGSYISRGLMAWGVRHITFVDNGNVSYSNPVRQPLYTHEDCISHANKAEAAASALKQIFPGVTAQGLKLNVPMAGHPINNEERERADYERLLSEIQSHDAVFLLMDSRESRWLPTVICQALKKTVINVALGFDSYVVMRHGVNHNLGCYFCNDVVAPQDSISRQTLDQMCTVTRPGCAMIASGYAVELFAQVQQHEALGEAPVNAETPLGPMPHQLRGFLSSHEIMKVWGPAFDNCSACGPSVKLWEEHGWQFVKEALDDPNYLSERSGLTDLQRQVDELEIDSDSDDGLN